MNHAVKWNSVINSLLTVRDLWEELRQDLQKGGLKVFQSLPIQLQKGLPNVHAPFDIAIIRLIEKQRGYGTLEDLLIPLDEDEETEEINVERRSARRGSTGRRSGTKD